jgi:hypothetical protein
MLLGAVDDIFCFARGRSWSDFKKNISGEQIRELYMVQARLWPRGIDWAALMPNPGDGKLSALYLGDIRPELTFSRVTSSPVSFRGLGAALMVSDPSRSKLVELV